MYSPFLCYVKIAAFIYVCLSCCPACLCPCIPSHNNVHHKLMSLFLHHHLYPCCPYVSRLTVPYDAGNWAHKMKKSRRRRFHDTSLPPERVTTFWMEATGMTSPISPMDHSAGDGPRVNHWVSLPQKWMELSKPAIAIELLVCPTLSTWLIDHDQSMAKGKNVSCCQENTAQCTSIANQLRL
jgi:hypothetical protein